MLTPDRIRNALACFLATLVLVVCTDEVVAQQPAPPAPQPAYDGPAPFGANLFSGAFLAQRDDGINPDYRILPGDRVAVAVWGVAALSDVFVVDTQGNILLPAIGPIHLAGVRSAELTRTVHQAISRVYRGGYEVYTNLLTASPVAVFVTGGVRRPGRYAGIPSDSVLFFLDQAGGIDPLSGTYRRITVLRRGQEIAELDLYDFLLRGTLANPQLEDGDTILVGRRGPAVELRGVHPQAMLVELRGEAFTGEDVLSILPATPQLNEVTLQGSRERMPMLRTMSLAGFRVAAVADGDIVTFRADHRADNIIIGLEGEFQGPSWLSVRRGARLLDVLNYVPIDPELAVASAIHIKRVRVAREQQRSIQDALDRLQRSTLLALSDTQSEATIRGREAELVAQFVASARNVQPLGRVVTASDGLEMNVVLEEGDTIVIPTRTNVVRVGGAVQLAQALMYRPGQTAADYVEAAGGFADRAERGSLIVLSQDASIVVGDLGTEIRPGDEILVPPRVDDKIFQNAMDLSSVIYQAAVAASVLIAL